MFIIREIAWARVKALSCFFLFCFALVIHSFIYLFIYLFIYSFIFIYLFIYLLICLYLSFPPSNFFLLLRLDLYLLAFLFFVVFFFFLSFSIWSVDSKKASDIT
jgi:hypothetical protein